MHVCINKWQWAPQGRWTLFWLSLNPGLAACTVCITVNSPGALISKSSLQGQPGWGGLPSPGPGATTPGGRGRRRAAGPVPRHHPREAGPGSTPCACCCHCCAPAGPGAWAPRLPSPQPPPPACRGERAQGPGRAAPWLFTAQRSAASPTLPVTASFSVSSSRGSHRAPRRAGGSGWERGLHPSLFRARSDRRVVQVTFPHAGASAEPWELPEMGAAD